MDKIRFKALAIKEALSTITQSELEELDNLSEVRRIEWEDDRERRAYNAGWAAAMAARGEIESKLAGCKQPA